MPQALSVTQLKSRMTHTFVRGFALRRKVGRETSLSSRVAYACSVARAFSDLHRLSKMWDSPVQTTVSPPKTKVKGPSAARRKALRNWIRSSRARSEEATPELKSAGAYRPIPFSSVARCLKRQQATLISREMLPFPSAKELTEASEAAFQRAYAESLRTKALQKQTSVRISPTPSPPKSATPPIPSGSKLVPKTPAMAAPVPSDFPSLPVSTPFLAIGKQGKMVKKGKPKLPQCSQHGTDFSPTTCAGCRETVRNMPIG